MNGLLQQQESGQRPQGGAELARRGRVRFTVRSLGGKLVISAALLLLLCMLLFGALSWYAVKAFYERAARGSAATNLNSISRAYVEQSEQHLSTLAKLATSAEVAGVFTQQVGAQQRLTTEFTLALVRDRLTGLALMDMDGRTLAQAGESLPGGLHALISAGLRGQRASTLAKQENAWVLALTVS